MTKPKRGTWNIEKNDQPPSQSVDDALKIPAMMQNLRQGNDARHLMMQDALDRQEMFEPETPLRSLDDLVVSDVTIAQIRAMLAKVVNHKFLYEQWGLNTIDPHGGRTAINLYGPPGTGKSFCAEAIAHALAMPIIRVNYAEIESKFVGDTPKNIKAAFAKAKAVNALLFFDEADSILGKRLTNVTQSADHGVNVSRSVMLLELDSFQGVTIFATNLASNYDIAFVRRILGHIEMPLPDHNCRKRLWQYHIPDKMETEPMDMRHLEQLAIASDGLSGGDILNCVVTAATTAVQRTGYERVVKMSDFLTAIEQVKKAKQDIGGATPHVTRSVMGIDDLPPDVRQTYNKTQ
jgi:ATP-dependent 26S proteasome regulatory subunit